MQDSEVFLRFDCCVDDFADFVAERVVHSLTKPFMRHRFGVWAVDELKDIFEDDFE
jgi:hypothetical protein